MRHLRMLALLLLVPLALLSCSKKSDGPAASGSGSGGGAAARPRASVPDALGSLVPEDAVAVLYAPSLDGAVAKARAIVGSIDPTAAGEVDAEEMLQEIAGPAAPHVDRTRPVAFAFRLVSRREGREPEPVPYVILPLKDVEAAKKAFADAPVAYAGTYVVVSPMGDAKVASKASPLVDSLPSGDVVLRADLVAVVAKFRPQIDELLGKGLKEMGRQGTRSGGGTDLSGLFESLGKLLRDVVDSAERLDVVVRAEGAVVDLDATFVAKEGSPLAAGAPARGDLAGLAGCLPKDFPVVVLLTMDFEKVMGALEPLMKSLTASLPAESRAAFEKQMAASKQLYGLMGDTMAMGMGFGSAGLEGVFAGNAKDAKAYVAKMDEAIRTMGDTTAEMGMAFEVLPEATVEGAAVRGWRMKIDWKRLMDRSAAGRPLPPEAEAQLAKMEGVFASIFGSEGIRYRVAAVGDRVVGTFGGDDDLLAKTIAAAKSGGKAPPALAASLAKSGGKPSFLLHLEVRGLLQQVFGALAEAVPPEEAARMPSVPSGAPVPIVIHATADGRQYHGGLSADVGEVVKLVQSLIQQVAPRGR